MSSVKFILPFQEHILHSIARLGTESPIIPSSVYTTIERYASLTDTLKANSLDGGDLILETAFVLGYRECREELSEEVIAILAKKAVEAFHDPAIADRLFECQITTRRSKVDLQGSIAIALGRGDIGDDKPQAWAQETLFPLIRDANPALVLEQPKQRNSSLGQFAKNVTSSLFILPKRLGLKKRAHVPEGGDSRAEGTPSKRPRLTSDGAKDVSADKTEGVSMRLSTTEERENTAVHTTSAGSRINDKENIEADTALGNPLPKPAHLDRQITDVALYDIMLAAGHPKLVSRPNSITESISTEFSRSGSAKEDNTVLGRVEEEGGRKNAQSNSDLEGREKMIPTSSTFGALPISNTPPPSPPKYDDVEETEDLAGPISVGVHIDSNGFVFTFHPSWEELTEQERTEVKTRIVQIVGTL